MKEMFFLAILFCFFNGLGKAEIEPNASFGEANTIDIGVLSYGKIQVNGDKDYFKFNVGTSGIIELQIISVPSNINLGSYIYAPDSTIIRMTGITTGSGQTYSLWVSTCQIGTYYIRLFDGGLPDANQNEDYIFQVNFIAFNNIDDCECLNHDFGTACEIETDTDISALIAPAFNYNGVGRDEDYYRFEVTTPGVIELEIKNVPDNIDINSSIYAPDSTLIRGTTSFTGSGQGYSLFVSTCNIGYHYIRIRDGSLPDDNPDEAYIFSVNFTPFSLVDNCECNDNFNNACEISTMDEISAIIAPRFNYDGVTHDEDFYKFSIPSAGVIEFQLLEVPDNLALDAKVFTSDSIELRKMEGSFGVPYSLWLSICDLGEYYLHIRSGETNLEEPYRFKMNFTPFIVYDSCECNNTFDDACELIRCVSKTAFINPLFGNTSSTRDIDYYKFFGLMDEELNIEIQNVPQDIDICLKIYDENQNQIESYNFNNGQDVKISFLVPSTGNYYAAVSDCGNDFNADEQYVIRIGCNTISSNTPTKSEQLLITPNPTSGWVSMEKQFSSIIVTSLAGKSLIKESNTSSINLHDLPNGLYLLHLCDNRGESIVRKVVVEK